MFSLHESLDEPTRAALAEYDDLTAALLARRGMLCAEDAAAFLSPSYDEHLSDPLKITDMEKAARRLAKAITEHERIAVWSDYDCDGIPGGVLLHDFLRKACADFENYIPHRHLEGYGVNVAGIEKLAASGARLVVTVDSGIVDNEAVARANELGLEIIVTDHHLPGATLPDAYAVVNPNARENETSSFRSFCGAALAWQLVRATLSVDPSLRERVPAGWEKWLLDMVGFATIADMVPLVGENRVIASYGLVVLRKSPRIGLQKLCAVARVNQRTLMEDDVGFMLAPRVNAASRMGDPMDAFRLLTTDNEDEADLLAKKLEKANRERRASAGAITREVHGRLKDRGDLPPVIAMGNPEWRPALLGLVANGIAETYDRPVFLWGREANLSLKGSCRSDGSVHVVELMTAARETFVQFGGHAFSGGFTVRDEAIFSFESRLVEAHAVTPVREDAGDRMRADAALSPSEATLDLLSRIEKLAPFGEGNPKPVFLVRDAGITKVLWFGKGEDHLKISLARDDSPLEAVSFYAKRELGNAVADLAEGARVTFLANIERDQFSRGRPVRLRIISLS